MFLPTKFQVTALIHEGVMLPTRKYYSRVITQKRTDMVMGVEHCTFPHDNLSTYQVWSRILIYLKNMTIHLTKIELELFITEYHQGLEI